MKIQQLEEPARINRAIGKNGDRTILALFPSLWRASQTREEKKSALTHLAVLYNVGSVGSAQISKLSNALRMPRSKIIRELDHLITSSLVKKEICGKSKSFSLTTTGLVVLSAFDEFRNWTRTKTNLCSQTNRNDVLAYALLVIGSCSDDPENIYKTLRDFATQGHSFETATAEAIACSLLQFYKQKLRDSSMVPPNYLSVFKEFTTAGFQDVFRTLLVAIKPTSEDYNWLIEFFNQIAEFYFDPQRTAYVHLLKENSDMRLRLEEYKQTQDKLIKKTGSNLEVTFTIPGTATSKIEPMPPHLQAIGMRLILEPSKFINQELCSYFWAEP